MSSYCGRICPGLRINRVILIGGDLAVGGAHESLLGVKIDDFCIVVPGVVLP